MTFSADFSQDSRGENSLHVVLDCDAGLAQLQALVLLHLLRLPLSPPFPSTSTCSAWDLPDSLLRRLQFRKGHNLNVGLLVESEGVDPDGHGDGEQQSLKEWSLYHGATLRLQVSDSIATEAHEQQLDSVVIRFCVVMGNDTSSAVARAGKHTPHHPGTRCRELCLPLDDPKETLAAMKQRALQLHWAAEESHQVQSDEIPRRMRKTNWADECTDDLLLEVASNVVGEDGDGDGDEDTTVAVTVGSALSCGSLKHHDLLLLEEGELPDPDSLSLQVYLWPPLILSCPPPPVPLLETLTPAQQDALMKDFENLVQDKDPELDLSQERGGHTPGRQEWKRPSMHPDTLAKLSWLPSLRVGKCRKSASLSDLYQACYEALGVLHDSMQQRLGETEDSIDGEPSVPWQCECLPCVVVVLHLTIWT